MKLFVRACGALAAVMVSASGVLAATRVEHAPPPARAGVVEPAKVERAPSVASGEPRLVPNAFPDPASLGSFSEPPLDRTAFDAALTEVESAEESLLAFPPIDTRIEGPYEDGVAPPDCVLAVGRTTLVALVNVRIEIYSKSGTRLQGPLSLASFFGIPPEFGVFDPLAIYDPFSDRFIVAVLARYGAQQDSRIYVAFSQTNDASGAWNKYWIDADAGQAGNWADYGSIGIDRLAVYFTANMFTAGGGFSNATLFVYSKDDGYAGVPLRNSHIINVRTPSGGSSYRLRPATVPTVVPGDEYYLAHTDSFLGDRISLWRLTGDRFASPSLASSSVALPGTYGPPPKGRQPGTSTRVDSLGANLWNVLYEQGRLWTAQAIAGSQGAAVWVSRIDVLSSPAIREQTYSIEVTGKDVFFPYVVPDVEDHDFAMLSAFSGPDLRPTARYWNVDALGTVRFAELLADSTLNNFSNRHGDYFGIQSDPTDRNRIWMIGQYMKNSLFSGNTAIASVRFEDVTPPSDPPPIPDGKDVLGQPITVSKAEGDNVTIAWDASTCPPAGTHLVWYDLASMASHAVTAETCATGTAGTWTGAPPSGSVAVIVVADDGASIEGSHGRDGAGIERPSQSLACGFNSKSTAGTCGP